MWLFGEMSARRMAIDSEKAAVAPQAHLKKEGRREIAYVLMKAPDRGPLRVAVRPPVNVVDQAIVPIGPFYYQIGSQACKGRVGSLLCSKKKAVRELVQEAAHD
jgi:hypothetical protein